jgi:hypothetical protein
LSVHLADWPGGGNGWPGPDSAKMARLECACPLSGDGRTFGSGRDAQKRSRRGCGGYFARARGRGCARDCPGTSPICSITLCLAAGYRPIANAEPGTLAE